MRAEVAIRRRCGNHICDMPTLTPHGPGLWTAEGPAVPFAGIPYATRMTVMRLADGGVVLHSPIARRPDLDREVSEIGPVRHILAPNKLHHLFVMAWLAAHPGAKAHAAPGLARRRPAIPFASELGDAPHADWAGEIDQVVVRGSFLMDEVVFFHRASRSLIVTDLIQRFDEATLTGWRRAVMRAWGLTAPGGRAPLEWRVSFMFGRKKLRAAVDTMCGWAPERIIISHGLNVTEDATGYLRRAFAWA